MSQSQLTDALQSLLGDFSRSGIRELHVRSGDFELFVSTDASASGRLASTSAPVVAPAPAPAAAIPSASAAPPPSAPAVPEGAIIIPAPNLGTFYRAPKPGAANYVELGSKVKSGDELCLIEVMKLFTALRAEEAGTIHAILVEDGAMVEGGQPLFALVKD